MKRNITFFILLYFISLFCYVPLAKALSGDGNGDGKVDGVDFAIWLSHLDETNSGGQSVGDYNGDGKIDGVDYVVWLSNYGKSSSPTPTHTNTVTPTRAVTNTPSLTPTKTGTSTPVPTVPPGDAKHVYSGQSLNSAINALNSGETLYVHAGTYTGTISASKSNVTIKAWPGDRVVVVGLVRFTLSNSLVDGINVTWPSGASSSEHMVRFSGGSNWTYQNAEVWGAHSFAGIHVTGDSNSGWTLRNLYVHDTYASNSTNQDHLVYVSSTASGLIERCLFVHSPNGRGVKLGTSGAGSGPKNVTIRYNTFYDNTGPSNIQLSYGAAGNQIYRNIFVKSSSYNVTAYTGMGSGNNAHDNIGWLGTDVVDPAIPQSNNQKLDPQLSSDYHPGNPQAQAYGKFAP
jgi:hypothetical protein